MIKVQSLTKNYSNAKVVDDLSFTVEAGQLVGFLGANGAGKTTTLNMIAGVLLPSSGDVFINGKNIFSDLSARKDIGYLPDSPPLIDSLTVVEYLKYVAQLKEISYKVINREVSRVIELCQLEKVKQRVCGVLSKGYRQRVGLAQALLGEPKCLILDEPTVGLDPVQIFEFRKLLRSFKGQLSIFMSTHILSDVEAVCNDVIVVDGGRVILQSSLEALLKQHQQQQKLWVRFDDKNVVNKFKSFISDNQSLKLIDEKNNSVLIDLNLNKIKSNELLKILVENNFSVQEFKHENIHLEDIYLKLR